MFDASAVLEQWRRFYPARLAIDASLLSFNTVECPLFLEEASVFSDDGFVLLKAPAAGREYEGAVSSTAHVSAMAFGSLSSGRAMLERARTALRELRFEAWQFGGDWRHFFPGVPVECTRLIELLESSGFERKGAQYDVERDLRHYEPPVPPSPFARRCGASDAVALDEFLAREFPGRWRRDTMDKLTEDPSRVYGLFLEGTCEGFAMTQMDGDAHRRAGAVWSASLGEGWAALGPIGVSSSLRGQGFGHALLAAALCSLRDQGTGRTIIDWTTLTDFYGRHGFVPSCEYATYVGPVVV